MGKLKNREPEVCAYRHCANEFRPKREAQRFCSPRCREAASRKGNLRTKKLILKDSTGLQKHLKISKQKQQVACPEIEFSKKEPLRFEQVNEVTWKLTDGTHTDVPASHGQWGGSRTTKAVAWIMAVGSKQWVARCGDMASDPLPLAQAKTAAQRMVSSGLHDYRVTDFGAPDLNNLAVQCQEAIDQTNTVRATNSVEVLSTSDIDPELVRDIVKIERGGL
ncbi:unnamed protein product [marine sediment metagenome]|uniref:Uncharacterized protein n=1 Tax=marine sediment metagenome TaxID=412755 RepID=X1FFF5_9ZZZZ